ncbi:hypothetical protein HY604_04780 [Candidatus Peregrinibacteria bacterium]|nr:hypothetical protein [Candidatus Peregrinibacteria bacterium]
MPETPRLPDEITAALDRCVGEMKARLVKELDGAKTEADKLQVLASFAREINGVRGKTRDDVSGKARVGIGKRLALVGGLLAAIGGGAVAGAVFSGDKQSAPAADSVAKTEAAECPPAVVAPSPKKSEAESEPAHPEKLIPDYMAGVRDRATADRAAEGNADALRRATEHLKWLYLERKTLLEKIGKEDPERATIEAEVKRLEKQLRSNGIDPAKVLPKDEPVDDESSAPEPPIPSEPPKSRSSDPIKGSEDLPE